MPQPEQQPNTWTAGKAKVMDFDQTATQAPPITQQTIKPTEHEIIEDRIERDIHTHDVFPSVQPVLQREVLPTKHYVQDRSGKVKEVAEEDLPKHIPRPEAPEERVEQRREVDVPVQPDEEQRERGKKSGLARKIWHKVSGC